MKITVSLVVAAMAVGLSFTCLAKSNSCSPEEAAHVEEAIQQVETWPQFVAFYSQYKKCDVDALRYAFTQQVAHLAANDQGLLDLSKMLIKYPRLKPKVLGHLKSEAISSDDHDQILKALEACQPKQKSVCRDVRRALDTESSLQNK